VPPVSALSRAVCALLLVCGCVPAAWGDHRDAFIRLSKKDGRFALDVRETLPGPFAKLRPILADFAGYPAWMLKDINARPGKPGKKFFFDVTSLRYEPAGSYFSAGIRLNAFFGGDYRMDMNVLDEFAAPEPKLTTSLRKASMLVVEMSGDFRFADVPGTAETRVVFHGEARTHWVFYYLLPLSVLRENVEERVGILIDNFHGKATEKR